MEVLFLLDQNLKVVVSGLSDGSAVSSKPAKPDTISAVCGDEED